jgi:hypothetical protein
VTQEQSNGYKAEEVEFRASNARVQSLRNVRQIIFDEVCGGNVGEDTVTGRFSRLQGRTQRGGGAAGLHSPIPAKTEIKKTQILQIL